jgi:gliding motility-associated-like protein
MCQRMKKSLIAGIFLLLSGLSAFATHQRAAEITYRHISGLTFEVKIITYTYTPSPADRPELTINWGDGTFSVLLRTQKVNLPDNVSLNVYEYKPEAGAITNRHTYSSPGTYTLWMEDPNRNYGVVNIPNSVNVPMYVESELVINPFLGYNNSPVLLNPPIDIGCVSRTFIHNPGAFDLDGDSLSYRLVPCKTTDGIDIPGYTYPEASDFFVINPVTGDVVWQTPVLQGEYNIAFVIDEWRNGIKVGSVRRDMQIEIVACDNLPPEILTIGDTCVTAGSTLEFETIAIDPDGDDVLLDATGGPFEVADNPAIIDPDPVSGNDSVRTTFTWETTCSHVRKQPYQVFFKAEDDGFPVNLVNFRTLQIIVVSPPPENLTAEALGSKIRLEWDPVNCNKAFGYKIYRRNGFYGFIPGPCETGVPGYTGYELVAELEGIGNTAFTDDDNGQGLIHGIDYCYMVTAYFIDGAESYASPEVCAMLKRDVPVITNVSNLPEDLFSGQAYIAWSKPTELDTIQVPGPYSYQVMRAEGSAGGDFVLVSTIQGLNDTTYTDTSVDLNATAFPYRYRIDLYSGAIGFVGNSQVASSIYVDIYETDEALELSFSPEVPWSNDSFAIYRRIPGDPDFDSIGVTPEPFFRDTLLRNGDQYCYFVKSRGGYTAPGFVDPIINFSQIACGIPIDNVPPCPPILSVATNCDLAVNILTWTNPNNYCADDVVEYHIYFAPLQGGDLVLIDSTLAAWDTVYSHFNMGSITGCYAVTAIDSVGNISALSDTACISHDDCSLYDLPNVFTPNSDGYNDLLKPFPYTSVERVRMLIFNRWGNLVYETDDPGINWNGKYQGTNADCSDGTYFYTCEVYELTLTGVRPRMIRGSITLMR